MSEKTEQVRVFINGFDHNVIYYDLKLSQKMADHHYFSFMWQYTSKAVITPEDQEKATRSYIGNEVIFTFRCNGTELMSKGIIKGLDSNYEFGSPIGLQVTGVSNTIALNDIKKSRIFLEKNLQEIAQELFAEESSGEFYHREAILPTYTKRLPFKTQYNESSFDFLKRLSQQYAQWFYFDGMRMQFGQTKSSKVILINGASLHKFRIQTNLVSHKTAFAGYDYSNAATIANSAVKSSTGSQDSYAAIVGTNQAQIARPDLSHGAYTNNAQNSDEIEQMVQLQTAGRDANSIFYSGISYLPIGLGQLFTIQNSTVSHEVVAIEVTHHSQINGNYTCEFKAIPADVKAPPYTNVEVFTRADSQPARIKDNNDPAKMGRVKVDFYWSGWNNTSDWMRLIQPYAGDGIGSYVIPEIGHEVLVNFEGGNVDCPYVTGSHYNGTAKSGYATAKNDLKVMRTRSGIIMVFNDADGSVLIEDPSGNKYFMDGKGNIFVSAPKNIEFKAGEDIIINAGKNITTTATMNSTENIGVNKSTTVGMLHSTSIGGNSVLDVKGNFSENIEGNLESHTEQERKEVALKGYKLDSGDNVHVKSSNDLQVRIGDKS
jgi:type VI secretion system secreted protein VgrG